MLLQTALFEKIFDGIDETSKIRVITGYTSGEFLKDFIQSFRGVKLDVYIGMSQQGIHERDHRTYNTLMSNYPGINIYYQVQGSLTHIKLFEINNSNSKKIFMGSANLSYDGLFKHNELMTMIDDNVDELFRKQLSRSVKASSKEVKKFIISEKENMQRQPWEDEDIVSTETKLWKTYLKKKSLNLRRDSKFFNYFKLPLKDISFDDDITKLKLPVGFNTNAYFPHDKRFTCYLKQQNIDCKVAGKFNSELHFYDDLFKILREECFFERNEIMSSMCMNRMNETEYNISIQRV